MGSDSVFGEPIFKSPKSDITREYKIKNVGNIYFTEEVLQLEKEKNMEKIRKIQEDVRLPNSNIVLEKGDKIRVSEGRYGYDLVITRKSGGLKYEIINDNTDGVVTLLDKEWEEYRSFFNLTSEELSLIERGYHLFVEEGIGRSAWEDLLDLKNKEGKK